MKWNIFVLAIILILISSNTNSIVLAKKSILQKGKPLQLANDKPFKNPNLIYGSSFGTYFQSLYKLGKFEEMVLFTSQKTVAKYGKTTLIKMYQNLEFAFPLTLINSTKDLSTGNVQQTYKTTIMATIKLCRLVVCVENDSTKLVSCNLSGFPK